MRIPRIVLVVVLVVVCLAPPLAAADLEKLEFLAGGWASGDEIVEFWLPPLRGLMVGMNRAPEGEGMPFFEYLRIEARTDGVYYIASPNGRGTTEFKLTRSSSSRVVFENPKHDFPQKIIYTRRGDTLEAEVGGTRDGKWDSFKLSWRAVGSTPCH